MPSKFGAPIPGQSLTDTPKNAPWERPPEIVDPVQAVEYYVDMLADDELLQDMAIMFELGGDLKTTTQSLMLMGTMQGLHTVDVGLIIAPVVASLIKVAMSELGVEVRETNVDFEKAATDRENRRMRILIQSALAKEAKEGGTISQEMSMMAEAVGADVPEELQQEATMEEPTMMEEETNPAPEGMGLMAKGSN